MKKQVMIDNINGFPGYHITQEGLLYSRYDKRGRLTDSYHQNKIYNSFKWLSANYIKNTEFKSIKKSLNIHRLVAEVLYNLIH